jgi:hypothetical protein
MAPEQQIILRLPTITSRRTKRYDNQADMVPGSCRYKRATARNEAPENRPPIVRPWRLPLCDLSCQASVRQLRCHANT